MGSSPNVCWALAGLSGGCGGSSPAGGECCPCASAPLSFPGGWAGPAGRWGVQRPWGMAQVTASFLV